MNPKASAILRAELHKRGQGSKGWSWVGDVSGEALYMGDPIAGRTRPWEDRAIAATRRKIKP